MPNINKLIKQLSHKNVEKRIAAAKALGDLRDKRTIIPIMNAATKEDNIWVLDAITEAAKKIKYGF